MSQLVLGLDLGPNSIGWALVKDDEEHAQNSEIVDIGVRVFPEGVDAFDTAKERSRNEDRRIARAMRRQIRRRAERRRALAEALIDVGLWPAGSASQAALLACDPYELRARALTERLEPHEIGRVLLHLNRRRGFLSNRKTDRGDKEAQGMHAEINQNEEARQAGGFETIGAYLASKVKRTKDDHVSRQGADDKLRNRHLSRRQFLQEFDAIWTRQSQHHPDLLTEGLRYGAIGKPIDDKAAMAPRKPIPKSDPRRKGLDDLDAFGIQGAIFFQRPIYWPKSVVGQCELEPRLKRCPRADRHFDRFRVLQEVNNLRYADPDTNDEAPLTSDQRALVLDYLAKSDRATFDQLRKKLGFLESVKFNLEAGKRSALKGMSIDCLMAAKGVCGAGWHRRSETDKDSIIELLRENQSEDDLVTERLVQDFGFTPEQADAALDVDLPIGYVALSRYAIDRLLPHLEKGLIYQSASDPEKSALHAAGYLRRDELQRRLFDCLPDLSRVNPADCKIGDLPNPVVKRALVEVRKVVNAILRKHGKPDAVHVEMARSLQLGKEKRKNRTSEMRAREAVREQAAEAIRQAGIKVRREGIERHLLWQEQLHECVYCGKTISQEQLFGGSVDVDHVLPYSRTLDNLQMNKVVCHRECNHDKGQKSPYEWLAASAPDHYSEVVQRAGALLRKGSFPYPKYRRFLQKELELDKFIARQLTDTGYITRATVEYLQLLFDKPSDVLGLKGQLTAELRWQWGLDTILSEMPDSPAWSENADLRAGEKNRADHRHHAIDALVVALTNRKRLRLLSEIARKGGARKTGEVLFDPWDGFRDDVVKRVARINVSHRVERKVSGELHEQTQYGPTAQPDEWVLRKPVSELSASEVERVRDPAIRRIALDALLAVGIDIGRGNKPDKTGEKRMQAALSSLKMPSGVPIRKVRLIKTEQTIAPLRHPGSPFQTYVKPGNTHHICIFEYIVKGQTKRTSEFVTMLEATQRVKRKQPVIQRTHSTITDARFVMSLTNSELVLANWKGSIKLLRLNTSISTEGRLLFVEHTDARKSEHRRLFRATANTLDARKVTVDPLGKILWAND
jgi:CRISPR-associated endonuclease Csn1